MDARAALKNLAAWKAADDEDRVTVLVALATRLGAGWRAGRTTVGRHGLGELLRRDLGLGFLVVPGGWLRMGFSADDLFVAARARADVAPRAVFGGGATGARPTRWVKIRPFLLAVTGVPPAPGEATSDGGRATQAYKAAVDAAIGESDKGPSAAELVKAYEGGPPGPGAAEPAMRTFKLDEIAGVVPDGFRLPSEAELEWVLREGGTTRWIGVPGDVEVTAANRRQVLLGDLKNGFGLLGFRDLQNPCADGAVNYDPDSPTDQRARATDREERIARWGHTYWQDDDEELIGMLAGNRAAPDEYGETIVRLALDLPGLTDGGAADAPADAADDDKADTDTADDDADKAEATADDAKADTDTADDAKADTDTADDAKADKADADDAKAAKGDEAADKAVEPRDEPPAPLAEHDLVLAALTGSERRRQLDACAALAHLAAGPGHDVAGTAAAVVDALPRIAASAKADVLTWIADVQVGGHFHQTVERPERKRRHELGEDRAAVRAAVAAATDPIVACLDDAEAEVRSAAALALAFTVDAPAEAKAALGRRLARESVPGVQATLILACVRLGTGFRPPAPEPVIAAAIAIATAFDGPPNTAALIAATALGREPHLAFGSGHLGNVAIGIIKKLDAEIQAEAAATIATRAMAEQDAALALVACEMAFGKPAKQAAPKLIEELTSSQRQVVRQLADLEGQLDWLGFGLPPTARARRRYLSIDAEGPSDRFVAHGDAEAPLWYALRSREIGEGLEAAQAEAARVFARVPAGERLAIYLDRDAHALGKVFAKVSFDELLAAAAVDLEAARAVVDSILATAAPSPRGLELVRAAAATRRSGEDLAESLLAELDGRALAGGHEVLRRFTPAMLGRRLNAILQPVLDRALASDEWQLGIDQSLERWAATLKIAPSPSAARRMLLLGWASGQPAAVREAVGKAAKGQSSLEAILDEYDRLPQFTSWPSARAAMSTYAG